jgi:hypothetical protein
VKDDERKMRRRYDGERSWESENERGEGIECVRVMIKGGGGKVKLERGRKERMGKDVEVKRRSRNNEKD